MHRTLPLGAVCAEPRVPAQCPATDSRRVKSAAARLRRQVSLWTGDSPAIKDHLHWMSQNGFSREDMRQVRYTVEVFYNCEPIFAITHALAARTRTSALCSGESAHTAPPLLPDAVTAGLIPISQHTPSHGIAAHPFFRALAAWPSYGEMISHEMLEWPALPELVTSAVAEARSLASHIRIRGTTVSAHMPPESRERLLASCEIMVITSALRQMFINAEIQVRALAGLTSMCGV